MSIDLIDRLTHLLDALRGIARALDPDPVFSEQDRVNLYFLTMLLAEQLEACRFDITHVYQHPHVQEPPQRVAPPTQEQEDEDDD
jgi:hypothetical protein